MDIKIIKEKKEALRNKIHSIIMEFEKETDVYVDDITISRIQTFTGPVPNFGGFFVYVDVKI